MRLSLQHIAQVFVASTVLFSPTLNVVWAQGATGLILGALFLSFIATQHISLRDFSLSFIAVALLLIGNTDGNSLLKFAPLVLVTYIGIQIGTGKVQMEGLLRVVISIHVGLSLLQLIGLFDAVYLWTTYANEAVPSIEWKAHFLPQFRPSGIFPAPTYTSQFLLLVFGLVATSPAYARCRQPFFWAVVISGSTMGVLLSILFLVLRVDQLKGWKDIITLAILFACYYFVFPDYFAYNYSARDFYWSLLHRDLSESILTIRGPFISGLIGLSFLIVFSISFVSTANIISIKRFMIAAVCIAMPFVLHDLRSAVFGYLTLGISLGIGLSATKYKSNSRELFGKLNHDTEAPVTGHAYPVELSKG